MGKIMWKLILGFFSLGFIGLIFGVFDIAGVSAQTGMKILFGSLVMALLCFGIAACTGSDKKMTT